MESKDVWRMLVEKRDWAGLESGLKLKQVCVLLLVVDIGMDGNVCRLKLSEV